MAFESLIALSIGVIALGFDFLIKGLGTLISLMLQANEQT